MTAEDVETSIIRRLRLSQPPNYLKGNTEAIDQELDLFRRALACFSRDVLEQAWLEAASRNEYRCWPTCAAILTAAERLQPKQKPDDAWVEMAQALADAYTRRFMKTSAVAVKAREGWYERELKRYVEAAAWVQGQLIVRPGVGVGFDHAVLFGTGPRDRGAEAEWFAKQREQATTGTIKVAVPKCHVEAWRASAQGGERER